MAQWTQTLEPYIKVHEEVKSMALNPTAGEDLIIGVTFISDAGPSTPTLIRGQKEFLATYTSQDLTQEYIESLNQLYTGDDKTLAANMWANAYRLAGSNTILAVRASKADGMYFTKPLTNGDLNTYILKDGELLKKVNPFKIVLDTPGDYANHDSDGWNININGVGIFGNRTTDDGAQYDYFVNTLPDLVENLNDTTKFFSPSYKFYSEAKNQSATEINVDMDDYDSKTSVNTVVFNEVYLGVNIIDENDSRTQGLVVDNVDYYISSIGNNNKVSWTKIPEPTFEQKAAAEEEIYLTVASLPNAGVEAETICKVKSSVKSDNDGYLYMIICEPTWTFDNPSQKTIDLNGSAWSGFEAANYYATNVYNSATQLGVRIRRFNHDAVVTKELTTAEKATLTQNGPSPYRVLTNVLNTYTQNGTVEPDEKILKRDFYEIAVFDPSVNGEVSFFNVGNVLGRGDMEVSEVNSLIKMIQVTLPDDLHDLGLNYFGYNNDDYTWEETTDNNTARWVEVTAPDPIPQNIKTVANKAALYAYNAVAHEVAENETIKVTDGGNETPTYFKYTGSNTVSTKTELNALSNVALNTIYTVETATSSKNYKYTTNGNTQLYANLTIDPLEYDILDVSDSDFKKAMDKIMEDEVYTTEGLCDLGNTELSFQNYLANMAISEDGNYFYPISTVNSTNYMTIGNSATKISQDSYKLYMSAPWDIDTGTLGWKFYASPSVLYWESVARNRRNNNEFASLLGQSYGLMQYQRPVTEFNRKTRQLLLSRRVNTVMWNVSTQAWNMNDCYTKQNENNIMSEDGNSRLMIRISKAMPIILRQFIGRKITEPLCAEVRGVIDYFFRTNIIPMNVTVDAYQIFCDFDEALARQNKIKVVVNCRYSRSLKFIEVYNRAFDVGMDITNPN